MLRRAALCCVVLRHAAKHAEVVWSGARGVWDLGSAELGSEEPEELGSEELAEAGLAWYVHFGGPCGAERN